MKKFKVLKEWKTKSGYKAIALLLEMGFINGYVFVPENHFYNKEGYDDISFLISVHGGVTYSGTMEHINKDYTKWAFGFDTAHLGDGKDFDLVEKEFGERGKYASLERLSFGEEVFKDLDFIVNECENLATQLKELEEV